MQQTRASSGGNPVTLTYSYDKLDRITSVAYSDSTPTVTYQYNSIGKVTQRVDAAGTTTYSYDALGNMLSTSNTLTGSTSSYTYDLANALASATTGAGTVTYGYDNAHQLTSMSYPQNGTTLLTRFANNDDGQRTDVWMQTNSTLSSWYAHEHFTYDDSNRVKTVLGENGPASNPTTVINQTLCYSANSTAPSCSSADADDRSQIQWSKDTVSGETSAYTYNSDDRLTKVVITGGSNPRTYNYGYDDAGNRTSSSVTGTSPSSQGLSYNANNQITNPGYTYDAAGNLTASPLSPGRNATFNAAGQQTTSSTPNAASPSSSTYTYGGTNQNELVRQAVTSGSGNTTWTYSYGRPDSNGLPQIDKIQATGGLSGTGYVFHDPDGKPVMLQTRSDVTCLYLYNATSNPIALGSSFNTTTLALKYDPYGASTRTDSGGNNASWIDNPYDFGTGMKDRATGEIKFGRRWYAYRSGSWTQQDALNAPLDPKNANRYAYAADDPINGSDPTGRNEVLDFAANLVGAAQGFFVGFSTGFAIGEALDPFGGGVPAGLVGGLYGAAAGATGQYDPQDGSSS